MKHSKLCLLAILPLVFFLGCSFQTSSTKLRLAEKYIRDRQYKAARDEYKKVYDREGLTSLGLASLKQLANVEFLYTRDYESALQHLNYYSKVIKDSAEVEWSIYSMAEIYFSKFENYREALIMYRRIFERFPRSSYTKESLYKMAVSYERMSNFDKALSLFKALEEQESGGEPFLYRELAHFERANILYLKGSLKEALSSFESYLKKYPNGRKAGAALFNLGNIYEDQGDFELAAAYYSKVKARDPSLTSITALRLSRLTARKTAMLDRDLLKKFLLAMKILSLISSGTAAGVITGLGVQKYLLGTAWVVVIGTVLGLGLGLWTSLQIYTKSEKL